MSRLLLSALALALATAGCGTEAPGQAVPTPGGASSGPRTAPSASRTGEAPPINSPELDLTRYESRVCDLLTPPQFAPFGIGDPGKPREDATGPTCTWTTRDPSSGARVNVGIYTKVREGLEGIYARKNRWKFFEDAGEVNGYPAVHRDTSSNADEGVCGTTVGVRRDQVIDVIVHVNAVKSPEYKKPCSLSDKAASSVIDTVRGGR